MRYTSICMAGLLAFASPVHAQFGNPAGMAPDTRMEAPGKPAPGSTNYQDRLFAQLVAAGGMAEVSFGKLAGKSDNADVKKFGDQMVRDHSKANDQLKQLADKSKIPLPQDLDEEHQRKSNELQKLKGDEFDLAYIDGQIVDHQKTIQLLEWEIDSGEDAALQHFASDSLPLIFQHLQMAQDIKAKVVMRSAQASR